MSALETIAVLTNNLIQLLKISPHPSRSEIEVVFDNTQSTRQPRARALVDVSTLTQHRFAMVTPWLRFMNRWYYPAMGPRSALRLLSEAYPGAASFLESPSQRGRDKRDANSTKKDLPEWLSKATSGHALPYENELVKPPRPRTRTSTGIVTVMLLFLSILGLYSSLFPCTSKDDIQHFVSIQMPTSVIMLVEGNRKRNTWSLIWR